MRRAVYPGTGEDFGNRRGFCDGRSGLVIVFLNSTHPAPAVQFSSGEAGAAATDRRIPAMPPSPHLCLLTAPRRGHILRGTLRSIARSDLPRPHIFTDPGGPPLAPALRVVRAFRAMLAEAVKTTRSPWLLCLEDDIAVHPRLWHHLHRWLPFVQGRIRTFASLYNPTLPCAPGSRPARRWFRADPRRFFGAQALLIARPFARLALAEWDTVPGMQSHRLATLAAQHFPRAPLYVHIPSLVQHTGITSTWGAPRHTAPDFGKDEG